MFKVIVLRWWNALRLSIVACITLITIQLSPAASGADLDMYGIFSYSQPLPQNYYAYGKPQGGRFSRLGAGYYRYGNIYVGTVENYDFVGVSGSLSLEFWATPYYGASSGFIKRTAGLGQLDGGYYYAGVSRNGWIRMYRNYRWPTFELYEYTLLGWQWRDGFLFANRRYL